MSDKALPAIEVNDLTKQYVVSHALQRSSHPTVKDEFNRLIRKPLALIGAKGGTEKEIFMALDGISFEVAKGDVMGILGKNGSGKSTLFKILSRITKPTAGEAIIRGSFASLLEVGTGFHPELTGKENVYFNGSILGMSKDEIDAKFDKIVDFSEIRKFLDTPIKFYSSGMKVRLAFSVAAHLQPDVLLIDEVLAVGDVGFKQKSLERMQEIASSGTTVLFVSHIPSQIEAICTKGIVLNKGKIDTKGTVGETLDRYLELNEEESATTKEVNKKEFVDKSHESGAIKAEVKSLTHEVNKSGALDIHVIFEIAKLGGKQFKDLKLQAMIVDQFGNNVSLTDSHYVDKIFNLTNSKEKRVSLSIKNTGLIPGKYHFNIGVRSLSQSENEQPLFRKDRAVQFDVPNYKIFNKIDSEKYTAKRPANTYDFNFDID